MPSVKLPFTLVTGCTASILILSHVTRSWMTSWGYSEYCLNLAQVVQYQQWYRVFTFGVVYYNFVHLVLVTTALFTLGTRMERHIGSLYLINALLVLAMVVPLLHILVEVAVVYFYRDLLYECFVGVSSILCAMFVLEVSRAKKHWESILGYCSLSWWAFPWLTAIVCEVATRDHIAFLGHIAGILAGHMYTMDMLNCVKLPGHKLVMIEKSELFQRIKRLPGFVPYPESEFLPLSASEQKEQPPNQVAAPSRVQSQNQIQAQGKQVQVSQSESNTGSISTVQINV